LSFNINLLDVTALIFIYSCTPCYSLLDVPKADGVTNLKLHSVTLNVKDLKQFADGTTAFDGPGLSTPSNTGSIQTNKKCAISQQIKIYVCV